MGTWKLEVAKMALYMAFPVSLFYIFNQPQLFEDWTVKMRRQLYPPEDEHIQGFKQKIKEQRKKQDLEMFKKMEEEITKDK